MYSNKSVRALCIALLCSGSLVSAKPPVLTPENCEFMFDIHSVLLDKNEQERKSCKKTLTSAIKTAVWQDAKQFKADGPFKLAPAMVWLKVGYKDVSGEAYYHLLKQYNKHYCAELARKVARAYEPIEKMIPVVDGLHKEGFLIRAGSNVGNSFYNDLVEDHPQVFKHFEPGTCVEFTHANGSFNWNMIKKPSHDFFKKHYDNFVKGDDKEYCVFIDDKLENVNAANSFECEGGYCPFIAFHFDRSLPTIEETIEKLRVELSEHGIEI